MISRRKYAIFGAVFLVLQLTVYTSIFAFEEVKTVTPVAETSPARNIDDTADDTCIWIHPEDEELSVIIGDDKDGGLYVWDLEGNELQYTQELKKMNNLDLRYNFNLGKKNVALIGVVNEDDTSLDFFTVNPITRLLEKVGTITLDTQKPYGGCMYFSPITGKLYYFVNWKSGVVQQWELDGSLGTITGTKVREFSVSSQVEGCVADDGLGIFYLGEEDIGLWRFGAEPTDNSTGTLVDSTNAEAGGHNTADVEGVTIYYGENNTGYIICSSQGNSTFQVYDRITNEYMGSFSVGSSPNIDKTTETDGCDVTNVDLGDLFPNGMFVCHDNTNDDTLYSNHKMVSWKAIAKKLNLIIDTKYDPTKGSNNEPKMNDLKDIKVKAGNTVTFIIGALDDDGNKLTYYALNLPDGATFDPESHIFSWIPSTSQRGKYEIEFIVTDGYLMDDEDIEINVK